MTPLGHYSRRMRITHEPAGYVCPFCERLAGREPANPGDDIVRRTERAAAFVSPRWWPNNRGHVLVVPTAHHENLYTIPAEDHRAVGDLVQQIAIAMRGVYGCDGVTTRQHNEPAGSQHVWHLHVHVFPRYEGDEFYRTQPLEEPATAAQRRVYAERLRAYFRA